MLIINSLQAVYTYKQEYLNQNLDINLPDISQAQASLLNNISKIYTTDGITITLQSDGNLYGLGRNDFKQISDDMTTYFTEPTIISSNVKIAGLGYRFIVYYTSSEELYIKGHFTYNKEQVKNFIEQNKNVKNIYVSAFTILYQTTDNRFYYLGKNPQYDYTMDKVLYSSSFQELTFPHSVKTIKTQNEIIMIYDTENNLHLYGLRSTLFESSFSKNDIIATNNKNQIKYIAANGLISTYGNIFSLIGPKNFNEVTKQDLKDICLMNNEVAFIYKNGSLQIYNKHPEPQYLEGISKEGEQPTFETICNNDQVTIITLLQQDIVIPNPAIEQPENNDTENNKIEKKNNQITSISIIISVILILISVLLIVGSIIMLVFIKTDKLDNVLGKKVYPDKKKIKTSLKINPVNGDKKERAESSISKPQSQKSNKTKSSDSKNQKRETEEVQSPKVSSGLPQLLPQLSTVNLEQMASNTEVSKIARNDIDNPFVINQINQIEQQNYLDEQLVKTDSAPDVFSLQNNFNFNKSTVEVQPPKKQVKHKKGKKITKVHNGQKVEGGLKLSNSIEDLLKFGEI